MKPLSFSPIQSAQSKQPQSTIKTASRFAGYFQCRYELPECFDVQHKIPTRLRRTHSLTTANTVIRELASRIEGMGMLRRGNAFSRKGKEPIRVMFLGHEAFVIASPFGVDVFTSWVNDRKVRNVLDKVNYDLSRTVYRGQENGTLWSSTYIGCADSIFSKVFHLAMEAHLQGYKNPHPDIKNELD